ncbi:MAG: ACT domain-containing protein, partial [Lentisphaeria bacterium]|nr:ACT domain-containing protein [Lentisphaeria bacterium]
MKVRQLSIFLENKVGRLAGVAKILGEAGVNIRALSVADTNDFGILRLIVDDIEKAEQKLRESNVVCRINNVTVVAVDNRPGGLAKVLSVLNASGVNVEYM